MPAKFIVKRETQDADIIGKVIGEFLKEIGGR